MTGGSARGKTKRAVRYHVKGIREANAIGGSQHRLKGIREANAIFRLLPPAPPQRGGGAEDTCASILKIMSGIIPCYKVFASLMLFLDSHPLPPPTWEGVVHS